MRCDHVLVEGDAETGAGRQWEGAVHDRGNAASRVANMDRLAGRDRDVHLARDLRERTHVVWRHRLLDPPRPVGLELARDRDSLRRREAAMHLDEDLAVGSDPITDRLDERDRTAE